MRRLIYGIIIALFTVTACTSINCPVNNLVMTHYGLQKPDGSTDTLGVDTLWVWIENGEGIDDTLVNSLYGSKTNFSIPVSYTLPEDMVCTSLHDNNGNEWLDTIWLKKENYPHFEGVDCQSNYFHTLTGVRSSHRIIDTVIINKTDVNYDGSTPHLFLRLKARR